jgi:hypothetical protein
MDCVAGFAVGHDFAPYDWETNESRSEPASGPGGKTDGPASGPRTADRRAGALRHAAGLPGCGPCALGAEAGPRKLGGCTGTRTTCRCFPQPPRPPRAAAPASEQRYRMRRTLAALSRFTLSRSALSRNACTPWMSCRRCSES